VLCVELHGHVRRLRSSEALPERGCQRRRVKLHGHVRGLRGSQTFPERGCECRRVELQRRLRQAGFERLGELLGVELYHRRLLRDRAGQGRRQRRRERLSIHLRRHCGRDGG